MNAPTALTTVFDNRLVELLQIFIHKFYKINLTCFRMGRFSDALKDFEFAVQHEPENEEFKEGLSKCRQNVET